jgi:Tfp pilus assembly protein PilX
VEEQVMKRFHPADAPYRGKRQRGVVLIIALIVLIAMTLAGIGLVRSVDTGNLVAGNLAFKQSLALAGDAANEGAIAWLKANQASALMNADQPASGYYSTEQANLDVTNSNNSGVTMAVVDWDHNDCAGLTYTTCVQPSAATTVGDNQVSYIINRLCKTPGTYNDSANSCVTYSGLNVKSPSRNDKEWAGYDFAGTPTPYYRVTSRVLGPRNTTAFVQTVVHF